MARITQEERDRRDAAYRVWADNDFAYAAAAAAAGVGEKELRRWATVHRWHARWSDERQEEIADLRRAADEVNELRTLLEGVNAGGQRLFVPAETQIDAASRIIDICIEQGGKFAETTRAILHGIAPDSIDGLARMARGVDGDGQPVPIDPEVRVAAKELLVNAGLVTETELTLPLSTLLALLRKRLRERGFEPEPQA